MLRQQAKELLPIIQAYAEGKTIQVKASDNLWYEYNSNNNKLKFDSDPQNYRIKPEPKYRPFKNKEECWEEMLKHKPFGWVKDKKVNDYYFIDGVYCSENFDCPVASMAGEAFNYKEIMDNYLFSDGTPFGIKEE